MSARELDQFYTKANVVADVLAYINLSFYGTVIEPSFGDGAFVKQIDHPNLLYIDIDSPDPSHRADFLTYAPTTTGRVLVIGNPPFGKNSSLAVKFFNHAATFADTIGFIVPRTFQKNTIKNRLDLNFHLVIETVLPVDSFIFKGEDYAVPCVWQVWDKQNNPRPKVLKRLQCDAFTFVNREDDPDIAIRRVGVNAGRIFDTAVNSRSKQSHHFLKLSENNLKKMRTLGLETCETKFMTAANPSLGKSDIIELWSLE